MNMQSSASPDVDASVLQNSAYVGISIQNILYGIQVVLYLRTIGLLLQNKRRLKYFDVLWGIFSTIMSFLITVWVVTSAIFAQKLWLADSNYPGGPDAYWTAHISDWYLDWGTTAVIILQLMTDGLMTYRCLTIWATYRVIVVPVILWLACLVLGILVDLTSSAPGGNFFAGEAAELVLAYSAVSVFLNAVLTCMICYRIIQFGRKVREQCGQERASVFFGAVTLVVESMFPYTVSGIAFLISLGVGSSTSAGFIDVYFLFMCISPQMVVARVLAGRAWNHDIPGQPDSTIDSGPAGLLGSQRREDNAAIVHLTTSSEAPLPGEDGKVIVLSV